MIFELQLLLPKELNILRVHPFLNIALRELLEVEVVVDAEVVRHALIKLSRRGLAPFLVLLWVLSRWLIEGRTQCFIN